MTSADWLAILERASDSSGCFACGSHEICPHRAAEAKLALVTDLPAPAEIIRAGDVAEAAMRVWRFWRYQIATETEKTSPWGCNAQETAFCDFIERQ
jgi:hypothetical protein